MERAFAQMQRINRDLGLRTQQVCDDRLENAIMFSILMMRAYRDWDKKQKPIEYFKGQTNLSVKNQQRYTEFLRSAANDEQLQLIYFNKYLEEIKKTYT
ncbi:MAG: hypothetical protein HC808_20095 [Candidatus Competibacteraceae bacterium]|nr:hypothetical protein [Candidatus Competibacteraceae bacterium]